MIYADLKPDRFLCNLAEGPCPEPTAHGECVGPHNEPDPGTARVVLARWPLPGEYGPYSYDPATRLPIADARRTTAARASRLIDLEMRRSAAERLGLSPETASLAAEIAKLRPI